MLLRFWQLFGPQSTFYEPSRNNFPSNQLLFLAFGPYGRLRSLLRYGSTEILRAFFCSIQNRSRSFLLSSRHIARARRWQTMPSSNWTGHTH